MDHFRIPPSTEAFRILKSHGYQKFQQVGNRDNTKTEVDYAPLNSTSSDFVRDVFKDLRSRFYLLACTFSIILIIVFAVLLTGEKLSKDDTFPIALCDDNVEQARAAGCTWDQLMWAWYPPNCPHYANEEFLMADDWKFFSDLWGTEVTESEWEQGLNNEKQLFSQHGEHLTHCLFFFLSVEQVLRDGTPASPKLRSYEHLNHCVEMLLPIVRSDANYSLINTKTPGVSYLEYC